MGVDWPKKPANFTRVNRILDWYTPTISNKLSQHLPKCYGEGGHGTGANHDDHVLNKKCTPGKGGHNYVYWKYSSCKKTVAGYEFYSKYIDKVDELKVYYMAVLTKVPGGDPAKTQVRLVANGTYPDDALKSFIYAGLCLFPACSMFHCSTVFNNDRNFARKGGYHVYVEADFVCDTTTGRFVVDKGTKKDHDNFLVQIDPPLKISERIAHMKTVDVKDVEKDAEDGLRGVIADEMENEKMVQMPTTVTDPKFPKYPLPVPAKIAGKNITIVDLVNAVIFDIDRDPSILALCQKSP